MSKNVGWSQLRVLKGRYVDNRERCMFITSVCQPFLKDLVVVYAAKSFYEKGQIRGNK